LQLENSKDDRKIADDILPQMSYTNFMLSICPVSQSVLLSCRIYCNLKLKSPARFPVNGLFKRTF